MRTKYIVSLKRILKPIQVEVASYLAHENSYDINAWNAGKVLL